MLVRREEPWGQLLGGCVMASPTELWARARLEPGRVREEIAALVQRLGRAGAAAALGVSVSTLGRVERRVRG